MDSHIITIKENEFVKISITEWLPFSRMSRADMRTVYQYASFNLNLADIEIKELEEKYNFKLDNVDLKVHDVGFVLEWQLTESGKKVFSAAKQLEAQNEPGGFTFEGLLSVFPYGETINSQQIADGHYKVRFYSLNDVLVCFNEKVKNFNTFSNFIRDDLSKAIKELRGQEPSQRDQIKELQDLRFKLSKSKL